MYVHRVYCKKEKDIGRRLTYKKEKYMNPRSNMPQESTFRYHVSKCIAHFFGKVLQSSQYNIDTKNITDMLRDLYQ